MGMLMSKPTPRRLDTVPYPPYCVHAIGNNHVVVAGGGGAAKTGVQNRIDVYQVEPSTDEASASTTTPLQFVHVMSFDTNDCASMNMAVMGARLLAAGQDDSCSVYSLSPSVVYTRDGVIYAQSTSTDPKLISQQRRASFMISKIANFKTDFATKMPFQKCVALPQQIQSITPHDHLVTAGADGYLRVFKSLTGAKIAETLAHNGDVDSLDMSPDGAVCITIGHDAQSFIWRASNATKLLELSNPAMLLTNPKQSYRPRLVRFTTLGRMNYVRLQCFMDPNHHDVQVFVIVYVPLSRGTSNQRSYLSLWSYSMQHNRCTLLELRAACDEVASAMYTRGEYVAVGTLSGSVGIYCAHTLQRLYWAKEVHDIFVTGVTLLSTGGDGEEPDVPVSPATTKDGNTDAKQQLVVAGTLCADYACVCVSISADQSIQLHTVAHNRDRQLFSGYLLWLAFVCTCLYLFLVMCGL